MSKTSLQEAATAYLELLEPTSSAGVGQLDAALQALAVAAGYEPPEVEPLSHGDGK